MKKLPLVSIAALLSSAFLATTVQSAAAAESSPATRVRMTLTNADIGDVAKSWEQVFGGTVTVSDRAKARKVSVAILAPSKDELRKMAVAAMRENGIHVIERTDGIVFDVEPKAKSK